MIAASAQAPRSPGRGNRIRLTAWLRRFPPIRRQSTTRPSRRKRWRATPLRRAGSGLRHAWLPARRHP